MTVVMLAALVSAVPGAIPNAASPASAAETVTWHWQPNDRCPTEYWRLEPVWRRSTDEQLITAGIVGAVADQDGRIYVLNTLTCRIHVLSDCGTLMRSFLHEGPGPGEMATPLGLIAWGSDQLCVLQPYPAKLSFFTLGGEYLRSVVPDKRETGFYQSVLLSITGNGAGYLVGESYLRYDPNDPRGYDDVKVIRRLDGKPAFGAAVLEHRVAYDVSNYRLHEREVFNEIWQRAAVDRAQRVYRAPAWNRYLIEIIDPNNRHVTTIDVDYPSLPRPAALKEQLREGMERSLQSPRIRLAELSVEDNYPDIISLRADAQDRLWVLSSRGFRQRADGEIYAYDVFETSGRFAKRVCLRGPGWDEYPAVFFLSDDRILLCTRSYDYPEDDGQESELILCRVAKHAPPGFLADTPDSRYSNPERKSGS